MAANVKDIFRRAREAAGQGDFETARKLYGELWRSPLWQRDKEVQLRYAYSCERSGDYSEALAAYKSLIEGYGRSGTANETALVEESMVRLRELLTEGERDVRVQTVDADHDASEAELVEKLFAHGYERDLHPGHVLCEAGDSADHMWLLKKGEVDVLVPGQETSTLTGSQSRPCLIGELAYFTGMRRAATMCCATEVTVVEMPYSRIESLLKEDIRLKPMLEYLFRNRLVLRVLSQHEIFKKVNETDKRRIALAFENTESMPGEVLIEQGVKHPGAYMVQSGVMLLLHREPGAQGGENLLGSMHPGDLFHLGGLLRGYVPNYRVVAGTPCRLQRLPRDRFESLMLKRPWLIQAILKHSRMSADRQILHPEAKNLWAANRYIDLNKLS